MLYCKNIKVHLIFTICSLAQAAYVSRMGTVNRMRAPAVFRPGITLPRPWPRIVPAASNRIPVVVYRNPPHRYIMKHISPHANRNLIPAPWKAPRLPQVVQVAQPSNGQEFEFVRAAPPSVVHTDGGTGAIHMIPAPNLSLAEKPIVVIDTSDNSPHGKLQSEAAQPTYEVTEKVPEVNQMAKVEPPTGFSKANTLTSQELESLINSASAFQFTPDYNLPYIPQQYIPAGFKAVPTNQEQITTETEPAAIQQMIIQPDHNFFQAMQSQLNGFQLSPIEFIPFIPDVPTQSPVEHPEQITQNQLILLTNEEVKTEQLAPGEAKTIVQRETHESSVQSLIPQPFTTTTEKIAISTEAKPNVTVEIIPNESKIVTTTVKYVTENVTEPLPQNVTPIYYAQVGQSIGNVIANGFYSAINDVRAAAALAQVDKPAETKKDLDIPANFTTNINSGSKSYFVDNRNQLENTSANEIKHLRGTPFTKTADSIKVAYTLVRADEKDTKVSKEGKVYAGQIVEASISEDTDYNKEKANLIQRRAPLRLIAVSPKNDIVRATTNGLVNKGNVVKAKIPPKSTLMFDDKTGEPILRIYASYSDSPAQKEIITSKLSSLKRGNGGIKKELYDSWNSDGKSLDTNPTSQTPQFGQKILKDRSDDYIPLFDNYEE